MRGYRKPIAFFTIFSRGTFFILFFHCHPYSHCTMKGSRYPSHTSPCHRVSTGTAVQFCLPRRGQIPSPSFPYPLRAFLAPGRSMVLLPEAGRMQGHGRTWPGSKSANTFQQGRGEEGQVRILLSDNTSSNQIMGNFRGHHGIDWLGQSW